MVSEAQTNIVINGSFDSATVCPTSYAQIDRCYNWINPNGYYTQGLWGSPDFNHVCGSGIVVPPNTQWATVNPHSGGGVINLATYNQPITDFREYLTAKLKYPLVPDVNYTVKFWVTLGQNNICRYASDGLGVAFTDSMPQQNTYELLTYTPQFEVPTVITDTSWVQYSFSFTPTSVLNYITFGSFRTDAQTTTTFINTATAAGPNKYAIYFLDDIEVFVDCNGGTVSVAPPSTPMVQNLMVYPNPSGNYISVTYKGKSAFESQIQILDLSGNLVAESNKSADIYIGSLAKGMYVIKAIGSKWQESVKFIKE